MEEILRGNSINLQWFPGHMTKTRRMIEENLKQIDIVCELLDARAPISSQNPIIDELIGSKARVVFLNKCDLSDAATNKAWVSFFRDKGINAVLLDSKSGRGFENIMPVIRSALAEKLERNKEKGMTKAIRAMIVGIPNVGKSSLINRLAGEKKAKVEDRPGVTRSKQWINVGSELLLLDTPGILWPKFDNYESALRLAYTGAIRDDIYDIEGVAAEFLKMACDFFPDIVKSRYKIELSDEDTGVDLLEKTGRKRGFLQSGGVVDTERTARIILDEYRGGKLPGIVLEYPPKER